MVSNIVMEVCKTYIAEYQEELMKCPEKKAEEWTEIARAFEKK
jgi:hypothetical protein